jgi:hypothetical protein
MFNAISCSALKLSLLRPDMIQAVVDSATFRKGAQYAGEKRVRISAASERKLISRVVSNSGAHEQTIELKNGDLLTDCDCHLDTKPMCAHCVAALLEYHRGAQVIEGDVATIAARETIRRPEVRPRERAERNLTRPQDMKFSELALFIEWLQPALDALAAGKELPSPPGFAGSEVEEWIRTLTLLAADRWESQSLQEVMRVEIGERENEVSILGQQLNSALEQAKAAHAERDALVQEVANYRLALASLTDLAEQMSQGEAQIRKLGAEFAKKTAELEGIATSFKDAAAQVQIAMKQSAASRQRAH